METDLYVIHSDTSPETFDVRFADMTDHYCAGLVHKSLGRTVEHAGARVWFYSVNSKSFVAGTEELPGHVANNILSASIYVTMCGLYAIKCNLRGPGMVDAKSLKPSKFGWLEFKLSSPKGKFSLAELDRFVLNFELIATESLSPGSVNVLLSYEFIENGVVRTGMPLTIPDDYKHFNIRRPVHAPPTLCTCEPELFSDLAVFDGGDQPIHVGHDLDLTAVPVDLHGFKQLFRVPFKTGDDAIVHARAMRYFHRGFIVAFFEDKHKAGIPGGNLADWSRDDLDLVLRYDGPEKLWLGECNAFVQC